MNVCIVTKYYLPDSSITSLSAADLACDLIHHGHKVSVVFTAAKYLHLQDNRDDGTDRTAIKSVYNGKNKILRLIGTCIEAYRLVKKALSINADVYIIMTNPPLLNFFAARAFSKKQSRWIYWSLDLYPEAFLANGLVSQNNPLYKYVFKEVYDNPPDYMISLGALQDAYLKSRFKKEIPSSILPCGSFVHLPILESNGQNIAGLKQSHRLTFAYLGNIGEAHSSDFLKCFINSLDPEKHRFILSVYGSKSTEILDFASDHHHVEIFDYVSPSEFKQIDIHLASLLPDWLHICVPSKLVSAVSRGSCFLFYGPENSDSWYYLKKAGWLISTDKNMKSQIRSFLEGLEKSVLLDKKASANLLAKKINDDMILAYQGLENYLKEAEQI